MQCPRPRREGCGLRRAGGLEPDHPASAVPAPHAQRCDADADHLGELNLRCLEFFPDVLDIFRAKRGHPARLQLSSANPRKTFDKPSLQPASFSFSSTLPLPSQQCNCYPPSHNGNIFVTITMPEIRILNFSIYRPARPLPHGSKGSMPRLLQESQRRCTN